MTILSLFLIGLKFPTQEVSPITVPRDFVNHTSLKLGVKIQHPSDWNVTEDAESSFSTTWLEISKQCLDSKDLEMNNTDICVPTELNIEAKSSANKDLNQIAAEGIIQLNYKGNLNITSSDPNSTISHHRAYTITYSNQDNSLTDYSSVPYEKGMETFVKVGQMGYTISYRAESKTYLMYFPIVQKMIDSLRIEGTNIREEGEPDKIPQFKIGNGPAYMSINPIKDKLYVANSDGISVIDASTNKILSHIPIKNITSDMYVDTANDKIYIASSSLNGTYLVNVIDGEENKIEQQNFTFPEPITYLAGDSDDSLLFAGSQNGTLYVTDTMAVLNSINVPYITAQYNASYLTFYLNGFAVDPVTNRLYVNWYDHIGVIDYSDHIGVDYSPDFYDLYQSPNFYEQDSSLLSSSGLNNFYDIEFNPNTNRLYIASAYPHRLYVIDPIASHILSNITLNDEPTALAVNPDTNKVFITHFESNSISTIDGSPNATEKNILVGRLPWAVTFNPNTDNVYVFNSGSESITELDGVTNETLSLVVFSINPPTSGQITCTGKHDKDYVTNEYSRIGYGTHCTAQANSGFQFSSWTENFGHNSSRPVSRSTISYSPFGPLLSFFHINPSDKGAVLNVTRYGNFTANFIPVPPPISNEYLIPLYGIIASTVIGWSIPSIIGWIRSKQTTRQLNNYRNEVNNLYSDGRLDRNDVKKLDILIDRITDEYTKGKITKEQYDKLENKISIIYTEIFTKSIDSLNKLSENDKVKELHEIRSNIKERRDKGRIDNEHYSSLKKEISIQYAEIFNNRMDSLNNLQKNDRVKLLDKIKDDISDAYSKEWINEIDYNLLKDKLSNYERK